jgi:K+-transporting ATPase ATPase A chain
MWFGRFGVIVPVLAIAGRWRPRSACPVTAGTLPTHGPLFVVLLIGTVLLVGAADLRAGAGAGAGGRAHHAVGGKKS